MSFTLQPASLVDVLYTALRTRIVAGQIPPGERLTEARVSEEYSVARTTARACLERLTTEGILTRAAHKSAVVPQLTITDIEDLFFTRELVEQSAVASLAAKGEVPPAARQAQTAIERAAQDQDFAEQVEADIAFHSALVSAAGSERLSRMHQMIMGEVQLSMGQYQAHRTAAPTTVAEEHAAILSAIGAGDARMARKQLAAHLRHALDRLRSHAADRSDDSYRAGSVER